MVVHVGAEIGYGETDLRRGSSAYTQVEGLISEGTLTVPVLALRKFPLTDAFVLAPFIGPSLSLGLWSTLAIDQNREDWLSEYGEKINQYSPDGNYSRWNYAARVGFSLFSAKESGWVQIGVDFGLKDRYKGSEITVSTNRLFLAFSVLF